MLQIIDIVKQYKTGDLVQMALNGVSLNFRDNEFVAILGPSGSGKTTLLNVIGGLDRYDRGELIINGVSTKRYNDRDWDSYRNHTIGFIFQSYNLIPHQSVLANVELAMTISGVSQSERKRRAKEALEKVGLGNQLHKKPNQMSGGQMQRVAIARALVNDPDILLADEPTGALDSDTSVQVMDLLKEVAKDKLVIMVTHNPELAYQYANRIVTFRDGHVKEDTNPFEIDKSKLGVAEHRNLGKSSMSLMTSMGLSFNNLRTKKARTAITAFAGSIGIIGIALILSLSNGVSTYIDNIQKDAMLSYPIEIDKESYDMTSIMQTMSAKKAKDLEDEKELRTDAIYVDNTQVELTSIFQTKQNNLESFKRYLDNPRCEVNDYIGENGIVYSYDTKFSIYTYDPEGVFMNTNGSELSQSSNEFGAHMELFSKMMSGGEQETQAAQLMPGQNGVLISPAITEAYEVVSGSMPRNYDDIVLVLNYDNSLNSSTLYSLGLLPLSEYDEIQEKISKGEDLEDLAEYIDYKDVVGKSFYLIPECDFYVKKSNGIGYENIKDSKKRIEDELLNKAIELNICGVIRLKENSDTSFINKPIGYTKVLTDYVIEYTNDSEIVKEQKKDKHTNVLNGLEFEVKSKNEKKDMAKEYVSKISESEKAMLYQSLVMLGEIDAVKLDDEKETTGTTEVTEDTSVTESVTNLSARLTSALEDAESLAYNTNTDGKIISLSLENKPYFLDNNDSGFMLLSDDTVVESNEITEIATDVQNTESVENTDITQNYEIDADIENMVINLQIVKVPPKTIYSEGEELDLSGGYIREMDLIKKVNGEYELKQAFYEMTDTALEINAEEFNNTKLGVYPIVITKKIVDEKTGNEFTGKTTIYTFVNIAVQDPTEEITEYTNPFTEETETETEATTEGTIEQNTVETMDITDPTECTLPGLDEFKKKLIEWFAITQSESSGIQINPTLELNVDLSKLFPTDSSSGSSGAGGFSGTGSDLSSIIKMMQMFSNGSTSGLGATDMATLMQQMYGGNANSGMSQQDMTALMQQMMGGNSSDISSSGANGANTMDMASILQQMMSQSGSGNAASGMDMSALMQQMMGQSGNGANSSAGLGGMSQTDLNALMNMYKQSGGASQAVGNANSGNGQFDMNALLGQSGQGMTQEDMEKLYSQMMNGQSGDAEKAEGIDNNAIESMMPDQFKGFDYSSLLEMYTNEDTGALAKKMDKYMENPDDDILIYIYDNYIAAGTYDNNMDSFGVIDVDRPSSISIYADSFEGKDNISKCITAYNKTVSEEDQITYTDYVALLMSSITTIINVISYILIAFVAVSLVVSSIMIGIITYISVLERTKEIGILRAIGASKSNISQVFNAETFIIGAFSGLLGIIVTELIILPTNLVLKLLTNMDDVKAILPIKGAIILVILSIVLTLIGGFIPSQTAASKDPVTALRTE